MTGLASQAKYGIFNDKGEQVYYAYEGSCLNKKGLIEEKKLMLLRI